VAQVTGQSAEIATHCGSTPALATAPYPFNLRLLADLVGRHKYAELRPIRTQPELLDLYWTERIIDTITRAMRVRHCSADDRRYGKPAVTPRRTQHCNGK